MPKLPPKNGVRIERINTLLIDGNALFKRGYHGSHDAYNKDGEHVGGIYQFITVLKMLLTKDVFHRVYVMWDGNFSGKLRYNIYKDYKSGRGKNYEEGTEPDDKDEKLQQFKVKQYLYHLSIRQMEDEVVEADDFIALYCKQKDDNEDITIVTSDRDICQLIDTNIKIWLLDKRLYLTVDNYQEHFKHHLRNLALLKIIAGDNSDSIKGIKGVKEGTLLKHFPFIADRETSLEEILTEAVGIQEERASNKQKPLSALTNLIMSNTDGIQGERIYEINRKLVDLTTPMVTDTGMQHLIDVIDTPLSTDREITEVYKMLERDGVQDMIQEYYMTDYFLPFKKLIDREKRMTNNKKT
jgi:5'-3' exonuclease